MPTANEALLKVHACAFNGDDVESLLGHYPPSVRLIRDGHFIGEGPETVRKALLDERVDGMIGKVMVVDGAAMLVEWAGAEGHREPRGTVQLESHNNRVTEMRIDHNAGLLRRLRSQTPR